MRHRPLLEASVLLLLGCADPRTEGLPVAHRRALADTVATLFDSLSAIHRDHPDTGLLRRLHPPGDTIQFVEGNVIEAITGDSLFRRVRALHVPVRAMTQRFTGRTVLLLDPNHAVLTAAETVSPDQATGRAAATADRRGVELVR